MVVKTQTNQNYYAEYSGNKNYQTRRVKSLVFAVLHHSVVFGVTPIILFEFINDIVRTKRRCQQMDLQSLHI